MNDELLDVAALAAQMDGFMKHKWGDSRDARNVIHNRTDPRKILIKTAQSMGAHVTPQQVQQVNRAMQPPVYNPPPQQQYATPQDYSGGFPPEETLVNPNISFIALPKDEHGNLVLTPELQQHATQQPVQPYAAPRMENIQGFQVPDYTNKGPAPVASSELDEKLDLIIKEIKSFKKIVNKLNRLLEASIVPKEKQVSTDTTSDENNI